jgi:hypothetical protein
VLNDVQISFYRVRLLDVMTAPDTTSSTSAGRETVKAAALNGQVSLQTFYCWSSFMWNVTFF